jgi:HlyD family secretion protein
MSTSRLFTLSAAVVAATITACHRAPQPDAYGTMEATEVIVGAEVAGRLVQFTPIEGAHLSLGEEVAKVDATPIALQLAQASAQREFSASQSKEAGLQTDVLQAQLAIAQRNYERTKRLYDQQAATAQQLDQAERDYRTLQEQIRAQQAQQQGARHDVAASAARQAQLQDQMRRASVRNPVTGTVLATYTKAGEVVSTGQALYRIADLDTMELRAYVSEPQLARVRIGEPARVTVDAGGQRRSISGRVSWLSSSAEFTPTPIQTRDERTNLVYAVKIRVPNPAGILKIGMPADVTFSPDTAGEP